MAGCTQAKLELIVVSSGFLRSRHCRFISSSVAEGCCLFVFASAKNLHNFGLYLLFQQGEKVLRNLPKLKTRVFASFLNA